MQVCPKQELASTPSKKSNQSQFRLLVGLALSDFEVVAAVRGEESEVPTSVSIGVSV
jgi:hypothetical protein